MLQLAGPVMQPPHPQFTSSQADAARSQLEAVLADPLFTRASRQSAFLRFIVVHLIEDSSEQIKEHRIGVEVYGRKQDYDTREDPIVRVEAARLRAKLREYYDGAGREDLIRFELPKGTYVPRVTGLPEGPLAEVAPPIPPASHPPAGDAPEKPFFPSGAALRYGILAIGVLSIAAFLLWQRVWSPKTVGSGPSVAVLPFVDQSEGQDQGVFCEGLTDQVTDELSRISELRVAGRSSAARFSDSSQDLRSIGEKLMVSHVLQGSVRSAGSRVRVSARLVDVKTGFQLWSANLDKPREELFALQDEIARSMAKALRVQLAVRKEGEAAARTPQRLRAHNLFMEARSLHRKMNPSSLSESRRLHEQAVAEDPSYALAHSGLAHIYISIMSVGLVAPAELRERAYAEAQRAVELDPGLADGHSALIRLARDIDFDWPTAQSICKDAGGFGVNSPSIMTNCGTLDAIQSRFDEADEHFKSAMQSDPLWPGGGEARANMLAWAGRFQEAEAQIRRVRSLDPEYVPALSSLARILALQGRVTEALDLFDARSNVGQALSHAHLAMMSYLSARSGNQPRALEIERQLLDRRRRQRVLSTDLALVRLGLGDQAGALAHLEQAMEDREPSLGETITDPFFQPLRAQPAFKSIMRRLNL